MDRSILMKAIKNAISKVAPEAEIILYGSQAREDAGPESDWDLHSTHLSIKLFRKKVYHYDPIQYRPRQVP